MIDRVNFLLSAYTAEISKLTDEQLQFFKYESKEKDFTFIIDGYSDSNILVGFLDERLPIHQKFKWYYMNNLKELDHSEGADWSIGTSKLEEVDIEYYNKPVKFTFKAMVYEYEVPAKFKASQFETSGGGFFSSPITVPTEFTLHPKHTAREVDKKHSIETMKNSLDTIRKEIRNRIYLNDLFLDSMEQMKNYR